ncbi:MAG: hypothetical protein CM15mP120_17820 [Pseudomonadota bacterium]|nr:MAG: hypothetical protein CM15mP120_17820 [Pseudomonadota bacterium]
MVAEAKEVGQQRYRESYGRYLEDFQVGDVYEHRPGRSITETDNTWFTLLTMNQHPLHFDREYGAKTEFGQVLVNSCLTISLVTGMSVSDISQKTIANLGWIRSDSPVRYLLAIPFTPSPPCWPSGESGLAPTRVSSR